MRSVRTRDHKYVRVLDYEGTPGGDLFFDLASDGAEVKNLLPSANGIASEHRARLEQWMAAVRTGVDTRWVSERLARYVKGQPCREPWEDGEAITRQIPLRP